MEILGIDAGSSSIKAAILRDGRIRGTIARVEFATRWDGPRVEVQPQELLDALAKAIREVGPGAKRVDAIGLTVMAPSWVAMDRHGRPLTPIVTHQDRRSIEEARHLERIVGKARHLRLAGNRPFPGGISSTTFAWFKNHQPASIRKADLVGHLNTFLHRQMTGARVTDPSNASFMGVYRTLDLRGWSDELCRAVGVPAQILPEVLDADRIGGTILPEAARRFGLTEGTPMMVGCMDGSAAMLAGGARVGQLLNVSGSTDVLALCTDRPKPHERLLTRALGIGRKWMSVATLAAAGSALDWVKEQLFPDWPIQRFRRLIARMLEHPLQSSVRFEPYLAGDRMSIEQRQGSFTGLTLATTRQQMLQAVVEALAEASAARLPLLAAGGTRILRTVYVSGGVQGGLGRVLHAKWPGKWVFEGEPEATLRGLGTLMPQRC